jgi:hypothetical protein
MAVGWLKCFDKQFAYIGCSLHFYVFMNGLFVYNNNIHHGNVENNIEMNTKEMLKKL